MPTTPRDSADHLDFGPIDVGAGVDTDGDSLPDTLVLEDDELLVLAADTDRDGLADVIVEIGPDAGVRTTLLDTEPATDWSAGCAFGLARGLDEPG